MDNRTTILYTMNKVGFKYHIVKGELKKGSILSKKKHPLREVNDFRENLNKRNLLLDCKNNYKLKKSIKIGALMAYNLHTGELENNIESDNDIVIRHDDKKVIEEFDFENIYSTDSKIRNYEHMDSMIIDSIYEVELDFSKLSNHNPDQFSDVELLFFDVLKKENIISKNSRHGLSDNNECDIVDEENKVQIELVTEFKNRVFKDKKPHKNIDMFLLEAVNNNLTVSSKAIIDKFCTKEYTDKFKKELGIFCLGNNLSIQKMLQVLQTNLKNQNIKNQFIKIYIIWNDFISDKYYLFNPNDKSIKELKNINLTILNKNKIDYSGMRDNKKYLIIIKNIFNGKSAIGYFSKQEIDERVKTLRMKEELR